jgi:hypothetical protein
MNRQKMLVPYNFTMQDEKALNYVMKTYGNEQDLEITLFHLYTPLAKYSQFYTGSTTSPVLTTVGEKTGKKILTLKQKESDFNNLKNLFVENGFHEDRISLSFSAKEESVGESIIHKIGQDNYDIVVLSHAPRKGRMFIGENVHEKVLNGLKDKVVIIVI